MKGVFITATDTGAGKTVFGLLLGSYLKKKNILFKVIKPFETGCLEKNGNLIPYDGFLYKFVLGLAPPLKKIVPFRFTKPLAPYQASIIDKNPIDLKSVLGQISKEFDDETFYIFEGAGGLFVPLDENYFVIDLIKFLKLPVLIVSTNKLGTINHTLLTVEALKTRGIKLAGVVLNNTENKNEISKDLNCDYFSKTFGNLYLGNIPFIKEIYEINKKLHLLIDKKLKIGIKEICGICVHLADIFEEFIATDKFKLF